MGSPALMTSSLRATALRKSTLEAAPLSAMISPSCLFSPSRGARPDIHLAGAEPALFYAQFPCAFLAQEDSGEPVEVSGHCVAIVELAGGDLEHLVTERPQLVMD